MSKRNKRKNRQGSTRQVHKYNMTEGRIPEVVTWLTRMQVYLKKTTVLSRKMERSCLDEANDFFWALVKYTENVEECAVQLDNINDSIFSCLIEFPLKSERGDELSWNGLKGMRNRLAHSFWDIDHDILWQTITRDFPELLSFLQTLYVSPRIGKS